MNDTKTQAKVTLVYRRIESFIIPPKLKNTSLSAGDLGVVNLL
jgi:uncharacterized circularly permuted ATP-grasp superfamily protein